MSKCTLQVEAVLKLADGTVVGRYRQSTQFPDFASTKGDTPGRQVDTSELNNLMQEQMQYGQAVFKELGSHVALTAIWMGSKHWAPPPLSEVPAAGQAGPAGGETGDCTEAAD